ncbi:histone chaperone [Entomophthora muscae]|uniref:Histone chaperone n=1 Tax=Entomophthora muscae TaxID=34485 RepID=A0ACC2S3X4_9FUNG|nr:histone chaperone [Entomophthora muscae]
MDPSGINIRGKRQDNFAAPTPQNTPSTASVFSANRTTLPTMSADRETKDSILEKFKLPSQDLINLIQGQLSSLVGKKSSYISSLPEEIQTRINGLKGLQLKHSELESKFNQEVFELEKKYLELYKPLFDERSKIVNGIAEPCTEDVEAGKQLREEEEEDEEDDEEPEEVVPLNSADCTLSGIPEFWLTILKNHPGVSELINENDEGALKSLIDITYRFLDDEPGYALDFTFATNEYFSNSIITKKYFYTQSPDFGEFLLDRAEGSEINWFEGKDLTKETQHKKQVHKVTQETRIISKEVPVDSFFAFFTPLVMPEDLEELSEKEEQDFQNAVEADYELGEEFKIKIIPHAIDWFTGKALAFDAPADDYEYSSEGEEGEDDEE